jgi:hypothetical protein
MMLRHATIRRFAPVVVVSLSLLWSCSGGGTAADGFDFEGAWIGTLTVIENTGYGTGGGCAAWSRPAGDTVSGQFNIARDGTVMALATPFGVLAGTCDPAAATFQVDTVVEDECGRARVTGGGLGGDGGSLSGEFLIEEIGGQGRRARVSFTAQRLM